MSLLHLRRNLSHIIHIAQKLSLHLSLNNDYDLPELIFNYDSEVKQVSLPDNGTVIEREEVLKLIRTKK